GITLVGRGGGKTNLGYVGTYVNFVVEYLFVAALCTGFMFSFARAPFCTECKTWKEERDLGTFTLPFDEVPKETVDAAVDAFSKGKVARLVNHDPEAETITLSISAFVCPNCGPGAPVDATLKSVEQNAKGEPVVIDLVKITYPAEALPVLV